MSQETLSAASEQTLERLRAHGCEVFGPGPMTPGQTTPTPDAATRTPGMHVQIRCGHRFVEGLGATADEAVSDALAKLEGYDPTGSVRG
jgi:hypothetical protein